MTLQSAADFLREPMPALRPVIKPMILPEESLMFLWGEQESFKSWLVLDLAWSVSTGQNWLLFETQQQPVLLINAELPARLFKERWIQMSILKGSVPKDLYVVNDLLLKLDTEAGLNKLSYWCSVIEPGLIIIDNLYRVAAGDINQGTHTNRLLDTFAQIRGTYHSSFTLVHHSRKTAYDMIHREKVKVGIEDMTGSKYLANNASTVFESRRVSKDEIILIPEKMWYQRPAPPVLHFKVGPKAQFYIK